MTSRLYGSSHAIENHKGRQYSGYKQHLTDVDNVVPASASSSKSNSIGNRSVSTLPKRESTHKQYSTLPREETASKQYSTLPREKTTSKQYSTLPREETTSKQYSTLPREETTSKQYSTLPRGQPTSKRYSILPHDDANPDRYVFDPKSRIEGSSNHKSRSSTQNNGSSRRRSSSQHEDDITDRSNDVYRRRSSRLPPDDINDRSIESSRKRLSRNPADDITDRSIDSSRRRSLRHHENDIADRSNDLSLKLSSKHPADDFTDRSSDSSVRRTSKHHEIDTNDRGNDSSRRRSSRHLEDDITNQANDLSRRRSSRIYENEIIDRSIDSSRRRSRNYENDFNGYNNDTHRRISSERYKNDNTDQANHFAKPSRHTDQPTSANFSSLTRLDKPERIDDRVSDRRRGERNGNHINVISRERTETTPESRAVTGVNRHNDNLPHLPQGETDHTGSHSNGKTRNSSFRHSGILDDECQGRRSRSKCREEGRGNYGDFQDRQRSSSRIRAQDADIFSNGHKCSDKGKQDTKATSGNKEPNSMDHRVSVRAHMHERTRHRSPRSDYKISDDQKEQTISKSSQENVAKIRSHNQRERSSERRDTYGNNDKEEDTRKRSSSTSRSEGDRYGAQSRNIESKSRSIFSSSSKQGLASEERETAHRHSQEVYSSKTRHRSDQKHISTAHTSHRRSNAMSEQYEVTSDIVRQLSTSASDTSKEASHPKSNGDSQIQRRVLSDDRQGLESTGTGYRTRESTSHSGEFGRGSYCTVQESIGRTRDQSANRRTTATFNNGQNEVSVSSYKRDNSLSRRSSSSRSNHDTGFASSSSSPRRDDSQFRFHPDVSQSPYVEDECPRARADESRRRRRSKLNANNSLDVPGASLRKEQSLSSSGRGDSSFEEPYPEGIPAVKGNKKSHEDHKTESLRGGIEATTASSSRVHKREQRENVRKNSKLADVDITDNLIASKSNGRSSMNITKDTNGSPHILPKADITEIYSSTSTLKDSNITSKTSITESISSLLGRGNKYQQFRSNQPEGTSIPAISIGDKWRKLKQGILADREVMSDTLKEKKAAVTIFYAAAAKFMSSLPGVQNALSRNLQSSLTSPVNATSPFQIPQNENTSFLTKTDDNAANRDKSEVSVLSLDNSSVHVKTDKVPSNHSVGSIGKPNGVASHRPSIISTAGSLTSLNKRISTFALMTEKRATPGSETSSHMTPPGQDTEMKRRSKDLDTELTSFLPAEMSRREERFHDAARLNDTIALQSLLKEKVNINCRNSLDRTALHWAAANGNLAAAEVLIENGADLEAKDKYGMRPVLWAAWFGHVTVLKVLINTGANTRATNKQGMGMLHCAAENNHAAVISFIFESLEHYDVNYKDKNERTPLHSAAEGGHVEAVNRLLEAKVDLHKKDKDSLCSGITRAREEEVYRNTRGEVSSKQMKEAADEDSSGTVIGGMTAVHYAAKCGHTDVLKAFLLQGVEVDDRDVDGKTALHLAAEAGHKEAVDLLLDYTANPNSETVKEVTPLHSAAQEGHVEVCRSLVKYGLNVNAQNFGNSALHIAANGNHKEVARILIDAKCVLDLPNNRMQTPLHVAVESGHLDVVQILLAGGASLDTREKSGKSAIQLAARGNYVAVVDMLIKAERYYANAREYHDKDVGYIDPDSYLRHPQHPHAAQMKDVLWKLAMKQLKVTDWKKLAYHWHFTPEHVKAIEQEYTGTTSYKEHSYRLLNIWLHGVRKDENVLKLLFEALVAIERKQLAENVRRKVNIQAEKPCSPSLCSVS